MRPLPHDPFEPIPLTIEHVDSAAGSRKTFTSLALAMDAAKRGEKTLFAMPTEDLIKEMAEFARRDPAVRVYIITHKTISRTTVDRAIRAHIEGVTGGHLLFLTHEGLVRVNGGPAQAVEYHVVIDEVLDVILTRKPIQMRFSYFQLTWFLDTAPMPATLPERQSGGGGGEWTAEDQERLATKAVERYKKFQAIMEPGSNAALSEVAMAEQQAATLLKRLQALQAKQQAADRVEWTEDDQEEFDKGVERLKAYREMMDTESGSTAEEVDTAERQAAILMRRLQMLRDRQETAAQQEQGQGGRTSAEPYYWIKPKPDLDAKSAKDPYWETRLRADNTQTDNVFGVFDPIPLWLIQGNPLFTDMERWNKMIGMGLRPGERRAYDAGLITISGFRRPDMLAGFHRVTIMSALFRHTMLYALWSKLGVDFIPSTEIKLAVPASPLFKRKLRIYWLSEHGWSKKARDKAGGISAILRLIERAEVIDPTKTVCVVVNKDDGAPENPKVVTDVFDNGLVMPHNTRGQNIYREHDQLIYCAALNSHTSDIRWLESVLGIDARNQRIARLGQEVYQTAMRLSLRDPSSTADVTIVVIDKDVAEWLVQWFDPEDQVEVFEIDSMGVIVPRGKPGRRALGDRAMTPAERQRRSRLQRRRDLPPADTTDEGPSP